MTDVHVDKAATVRCRRSDCGSAFRQRPEGIDRSGQTQRMRGWAALAWALDLSPRSASRPPPPSASLYSVWRDVQEAVWNARREQAGRVTATGANETVVRVKGEKTVVGVATDAATGEVLGLDALVERDSDGFMEWLGDFARGYGVQAMAADDLNTYKPVVERLGVGGYGGC